MAEIGTVIEGKYEILREIGKGGMSVVYLAMDTHLNKPLPSQIQFQKEADNNLHLALPVCKSLQKE